MGDRPIPTKAQAALELKQKNLDFISSCITAHPEYLENLIYGEGWKTEKPKKKKKAKKGEVEEKPPIIYGENPQDVNVVNDNNETALYIICSTSRIRYPIEITTLLLENNADPNIVNTYGYSPLYQGMSMCICMCVITYLY